MQTESTIPKTASFCRTRSQAWCRCRWAGRRWGWRGRRRPRRALRIWCRPACAPPEPVAASVYRCAAGHFRTLVSSVQGGSCRWWQRTPGGAVCSFLEACFFSVQGFTLLGSAQGSAPPSSVWPQSRFAGDSTRLHTISRARNLSGTTPAPAAHPAWAGAGPLWRRRRHARRAGRPDVCGPHAGAARRRQGRPARSALRPHRPPRHAGGCIRRDTRWGAFHISPCDMPVVQTSWMLLCAFYIGISGMPVPADVGKCAVCVY